MKRRTFLLGAAGFVISSELRAAQTDLGPPTAIGIPRRSWVAHPTVVKQDCPEWCWAASISMIFASLGHPVPQQQIVARVFAGLACAPAPSGLTMAQALSSVWTDVNGVSFQSRVVAAYDQMAGVNAINNAFIVDELNRDRPLLYANTHHAMVVTAADYFATPMGPSVQNVGVLDPWPYSPDFHPLSGPELVPAFLGGQMMFLAAVHI